jgi:catechol 2,3-dioxygenase-like lactoylglutathione lyase family enzyme
MKSPWIQALRSVALNVPDLNLAEAFYTATWRLRVCARSNDALYFAGSGDDAYLLALHQAPTLSIRSVSLRVREAEHLDGLAKRVVLAGGKVLKPVATLSLQDDPAGGRGLTVSDADGRVFSLVHGDRRDIAADPLAHPDQPIRLAHAVLNSAEIAKAQGFLEEAFGFVLADRTRIMAFMNCNEDHHSLALGDTDNNALNHIAFLMPNLDSVMRGGGRLKDAGFAIHWGPGRHGPGDNAFNYFIGPFGEVIEYTSDVEQVNESYRPGQPEDWTWPAGRVDQWGISAAPSAQLKEAQRRVFFNRRDAS